MATEVEGAMEGGMAKGSWGPSSTLWSMGLDEEQQRYGGLVKEVRLQLPHDFLQIGTASWLASWEIVLASQPLVG